VRLNPDNALAHRELGVTYSKTDNPDMAATELHQAVALDPEDAEAWSNLGGALRRVGMANAEQDRYDRAALKESRDSYAKAQSRDSYAKAHNLEKYDLYSALNVARIDILLSKWEPDRLAQGQREFMNEIFLCRHMVQQEPTDWWRRLDLGDALLFSGETTEARTVYEEAINLIPGYERKDVLGSFLNPMREIIRAQVLDGELLAEVENVIAIMENTRA
jgi:tetratricopeptide (TPR) repeat protein